MSLRAGMALAERGLVPTRLVRSGIRRLLAKRLRDEDRTRTVDELIQDLRESPIARVPERANEQHYMVPAKFFELILGPCLKYSGAYWPEGTGDLAAAERAMLDVTCERAGLEDGQDVLELGCGWGSLSLHLAHRFPSSRIVAVSNSVNQRAFIELRRPPNLEVVTADMNTFTIDRRFDRVVSIEMFEHMRNYALLLRRIAGWLKADGRLFVHIFCHRRHAYPFETDGADDWMGRHFFTGGIMPSYDLLARFQEHMVLDRRWAVTGDHYRRTAAAWRENLEARRGRVLDALRPVYGRQVNRWFHRWRIFFLACEELFGYRGGEEWLVGHYRFALRQSAWRGEGASAC